MKTASLYFHIPFCTKKCPYCHFYVTLNRASDHRILEEALILEWEKQSDKLDGFKIISIYFGGGTPSLFSGIEKVLAHLPKASEITIEANPEECTEAKLRHFHSTGINRLSLGVQSLDDRSLQTLERIHSAEKAKQAILQASQAGFKNISIDLMYDLPKQTLHSFQYTLDQLQDLPIQHLSLYNLTIEPNTAFDKKNVRALEGPLSLKLLHLALEKLEKIGLKRYEISAFAIPGFESKHNLGYWTGRPFLGFGPSAFSYWEKERTRNIANLHRYAALLKERKSPIDFREKLPYPNDMKELLSIHIRLKEGADLNDFSLTQETKEVIEKLEKEKFLIKRGSRIQLTDRGMLFYDTVATELI